jgi:predicted HTH transcriptional regulator
VREQAWGTALPVLSVRILELAREHGRITTLQIATLTGENRSTIKLRLHDLVQSGKLARYGQSRSTWYSLT